MTLTPVQAHQMRIRAAQGSAAAALDERQRALHWLHVQKGLLAGIQSHQARHAHKAQALPEITPYLDGVLAAAEKLAGEGAAVPADPVVAHAAIWAIDAADWPLALRLNAHLIAHGLPAPDEFERSAATAFADLMSDAALTGRMSAGQSVPLMQQVLHITQEQDMPDPARAKVHKAIAYGLAGKTMLAGQAGDWAALDAAALQMALQHLTQAEQFDPECGVKKDIAAVQKLLRAATPESGESGGSGESAATADAEKAGESSTARPRKGAGAGKATPRASARR